MILILAGMTKSFRHIILVILGITLFSATGYSQSNKDKKRENFILTAVEELNNQDVNRAKARLTAVLYDDPSYDAAWYYMGQVALHEGDLERAETFYRKAAELDPGNFWYRYKLAVIYAYTSKEVAVPMYEKLLEDFPKKVDLYAELVELYVSEQEYEKALQTIYEMEKIYGPTEVLTVYAHRILLALGRDEEAMEYLLQHNSKYSSPYVLTALAEAEYRQLNDSTALAFYDEAIGLDPSYSPALLGKAEVCRLTYRYDEYFPVLNMYVENPMEPSYDKADYLYSLLERGDPKFIVKYQSKLDTTMVKFAQTHPGDSLVYDLRGIYYHLTGRKDEAEQQFREYVEKYPDSYSATASLLEFLMYDNDWNELSVESRKAYQRFPDESLFLQMAGAADYNLGDYDKVLETCDQLLSIEPADSAINLSTWSTMGDVYYILGDSKKAFKAYDKALKINPDYAYVLNNYAYYLSVEGKNLKKAYNMSRKSLELEPDNPSYLDTFGWILYLRGEYLEAKSFFKTAMLHGGKESSDILDHYAEVLYALKEYDLAFVYWNLALQKEDDEEVPGLKEKVESRRKEAGR
jgi:tetratricopeptide (TPR) repeat protein